MSILLLLLCLTAPSDSFVVNSIMDIPMDSMMVIQNVPNAERVLSITVIRKCPLFWRGAHGYAYEVVIVGITTNGDPWTWDTAYFFYQDNGEWLFYNDESLDEKIRFRRDA